MKRSMGWDSMMSRPAILPCHEHIVLCGTIYILIRVGNPRWGEVHEISYEMLVLLRCVQMRCGSTDANERME